MTFQGVSFLCHILFVDWQVKIFSLQGKSEQSKYIWELICTLCVNGSSIRWDHNGNRQNLNSWHNTINIYVKYWGTQRHNVLWWNAKFYKMIYESFFCVIGRWRDWGPAGLTPGGRQRRQRGGGRIRRRDGERDVWSWRYYIHWEINDEGWRGLEKILLVKLRWHLVM